MYILRLSSKSNSKVEIEGIYEELQEVMIAASTLVCPRSYLQNYVNGLLENYFFKVTFNIENISIPIESKD